jgi:alanine dehydrogenase
MKRTPPALLLDRPTVASLLTLDDCIEAVQAAFAAHARGETLAPGLLHGDGVGGEYHIKAGGLRAPRAYYACKVNSSFFQNRAAVMESTEITIKRTGAATAVAARLLAKPSATRAADPSFPRHKGCGPRGSPDLG